MRNRHRVTAAALLAALACLTVAPTSSAEIITTSDAVTLGEAIQRDNTLVTGASWVDPGFGAAEPAGSTAAGYESGFGAQGFPTHGGGYAVLSSGDARVADTGPNNSTGTSTSFGRSGRGANDPTILKVDVNVPSGRTCLAVDLVFLSEEYPEYVGSQYNDAALVELDNNTWSVTGSTVTAPSNFAFDTSGQPLTVNSAGFNADLDSTGTEFDGVTKLLTASTPITTGQHSVYFSIYDAGDFILDSAMLIDNLRTETLPAADCAAGAQVADKDQDGLPDRWETDGYDQDGNGTVDLDLPAMGADPDHKDLFVEMDHMEGLRLDDGALQQVSQMFAAAPLSNPDGSTGITVHIDNGADSVMKPNTGEKWGSRSRAGSIPYADQIGGNDGTDHYNWTAFEDVKDDNFSAVRAVAFRYSLSANRYENSTRTGIARGIPGSDFLVTVGTKCGLFKKHPCPSSKNVQTGTFAHELGHTLGFKHGGGDHIGWKPNYPSVMNYSFQLSGLDGTRRWDYSRFGPDDLYDLYEGAVNESNGFVASESGPVSQYKAVYSCSNGTTKVAWLRRNIDFNCDGDFDDGDVNVNLNNMEGNSPGDQVLRPFDDWQHIQFVGGSVGGAGAELQPTVTELDEATLAELEAVQEAVIPKPQVSTGPVDTSSAPTASGSYDTTTAATVRFLYGPADGSSEQQTAAQVVPPGKASFSAPLPGLQPGTYKVRAAIQTDDYTVTGDEQTFTVSASGSGSGGGGLPPPPPPPAAAATATAAAAATGHSAGQAGVGVRQAVRQDQVAGLLPQAGQGGMRQDQARQAPEGLPQARGRQSVPVGEPDRQGRQAPHHAEEHLHPRPQAHLQAALKVARDMPDRSPGHRSSGMLGALTVRPLLPVLCAVPLMASCGDNDRSSSAPHRSDITRSAARQTPQQAEAPRSELERAQDRLIAEPVLRLSTSPNGPGSVTVAVRWKTPSQSQVTIAARGRSGPAKTRTFAAARGSRRRTVTIHGLPAGPAAVRGELRNDDDTVAAKPVRVTIP